MLETNRSEDIKNDFPYNDILELEHPEPRNHPRQPMEMRAGQFSPFAALTGYEEAVSETERYTSSKKELDEEEKNKLDEVLQEIQFRNNPPIKITYFEKDKKKKGGKYITIEDTIKKMISYQGKIILQSGLKLSKEDIVKIEIIPTQE